MKRDTVSAYRARARATESMVDTAVATMKAEAAETWAARRAETAAANAPVPFTEEQYRAAVAVRTKLGWHRVVRVNAKSVTVKTAYSWDDRIPRPSILEVRA